VMMHYIFFVFFFFQAEDGIRDKLVTGVQTCALPIYQRLGWPELWTRQAPMKAVLCKEFGPPESLVVEEVADPRAGPGQVLVDVRSEERRVGKECRCRWWV